MVELSDKYTTNMFFQRHSKKYSTLFDLLDLPRASISLLAAWQIASQLISQNAICLPRSSGQIAFFLQLTSYLPAYGRSRA
jgi:hypothetical protein